MPTTSLKLSESLKNRVSQLAQAGGTNPHAFMVEAIERAASAAERRNAFVDDALKAQIDMTNSGTGYPAEEVHAYLESRALGTKAPRPEAVSWRK